MTLKVATIGAGFFAGLHVEAWARNPDAKLSALIDLDPDKAANLAKSNAPHETPAIHTDAGTALKEIAADIIDIAAPPPAHFGLIEQAVKTDAKAIICQKPFCTSLEEAERAVALAKSADKLLVIHENFRFQPWYRTLKTELDAGRLGNLYQITFRLRPGDGQGPDAYLSRQPYFQKMERFLVHETAIHWIDTFRFLMGEPNAVIADLRRLNPAIAGEDAGHIIFKYPGEQRAIFDGNRLSDHVADNTRLTMGECVLEGANGILSLDGYGILKFRATGSKSNEIIETSYDTDTFGGDCVYAFQKHVTDHLTKGEKIENTAAEYLRNMQIEEAVYTSAAQERTIQL